jgi:pSer/pThr/pTyr-binding forkhead associated (FHA) protein
MSRITLHVTAAGKPGRTLELADSQIKIGRLDSAQVQLDGNDVSRLHAMIEVQGAAVVVTDLGSATQTHVNGRAIKSSTKLKVGDVIEIGGHTIAIAAITPG